MANLCDFDMRIQGKKGNIRKFCDALQQNGNTWIGRGSEGVISYDDGSAKDDEIVGATFNGWCKWSVQSALIGCALQMRNNPEKWNFTEEERATLHIMTLLEASKQYSLDIEVFSREPGCSFSEHMLIRQGEIEIDEVTEYYEYFLDEYETKEQAEEEYGISITDEEWRMQDCISRGGFDEDFSV